MPRPSPLGSLKVLCIRNIVKNMDKRWCRDYLHNWKTESQTLSYILGPFEELPGPLLELIIEELDKAGKLRKHHLELLLLHHLESLVINRETSNFGHILDLLAKRCKRFRRLVIRNVKNSPTKMLNKVFTSLTYLQTVNLGNSNITDQTLSVMATHCSHIRALVLSDTGVTDIGISSLCHGIKSSAIDPSEKPTISSSLIKLDLNNTDVTFKGVQCALNNMPNLQEIYHSSVLYAVAKLKDTWEKMAEATDLSGCMGTVQRKLKLKFLQCDSFGSNSVWGEDCDCKLLGPAIEICPELQYFRLESLWEVTDGCLDPLLSLSTLIELALSFNDKSDVDFYIHILPLLLKQGGTIRILELQNIQNINIKAIGHLCPGLQSLRLGEFDSFCAADPCLQHSPDETKFSHLQIISISVYPQASSGHQISADCLRLLLSSCSLEEVNLIRQDALTDELIIDIAHTIKFPQLKILRLIECRNITVESIWVIIRLQNPLISLCLDGCQEITLVNFCELQKFIKRSKVEVCIEWS